MPSPISAEVGDMVRRGMEPREVAAVTLNAIRENRLYAFTHAEFRPALEQRFGAILAAFPE
jgi:hypothetical protein